MFAVLENYANMGYASVLLFALIGMLLTMIVQASSATFAIALIMCSKSWITFDLAAAMVLGGNIGTCITPLIASISGNIWAKRAAVGHLLFNVLGSIWTLLLYYPFMKLIVWISTTIVGDPNALYTFAQNCDPTLLEQLNKGIIDTSIPANNALAAGFAQKQYFVSFGLSMFHTVFNVINISIMIWLTNLYVKIVTTIIPSKETEAKEESHLKFISAGMLSTAELSILQAKKEIQLYAERTNRMFLQVRELYNENNDSEFVTKFSRIQKYENISDRMEIEIATYLTKVADGRLSDESKRQIQMKLRIISEIESIGDSCYNMARIIQRKKQQNDKFTTEINKNIELMFNLLQNASENMCAILNKDSVANSDVNNTQNLENEINNYRDQLKNQNVIDLNDNKYTYPVGITYMDMVSECEKMGDYIINVVECIAETKLYNYTSVNS